MAINFLDVRTPFISVSCGTFGERFREIAAKTGAKGIYLDIEPGEAAEPQKVAALVKEHPECRFLLLTQNETSTAVVNPIKEIIAALPQGNRPFVLVDGVSACGAMECFPEEWGVDAIGTASQKGLLTAPGLGIVWLSKRAWNYIENKKCASYYFDLMLQKKKINCEKPENPYTPPISLYYELDEALNEIVADGTDLWFMKHKRYASALAAGLEALGFQLLVKNKSYRSPGVTAFAVPGSDTENIRKKLRDMGIETAGGQGAMKGKIIRVAHYNMWGWPELCVILGGLYAAAGLSAKLNSDFLAAAWREWNLEGK
jgi:aspartate aminotransferase-like enzyme